MRPAAKAVFATLGGAGMLLAAVGCGSFRQGHDGDQGPSDDTTQTITTTTPFKVLPSNVPGPGVPRGGGGDRTSNDAYAP